MSFLNKFKKIIISFKKLEFILLLLIILLGYFLRVNNLNTWPRTGATFDEYAWTWVGMNIIQTGTPMSWSPHLQYENYNSVVYDKVHFRIVNPWLEHPPVFGILAGGFAILNGVDDMYELTVKDIRPLAVILGIVSILMVYLLTKNIYDTKIGFLAALLYAVIPTIVVGSRIVQNENFFIPVWLLSLLLIVKYIKNNKSIYKYLAAALCGILILSKIPWIAAAGSIFLILMYLKNYKDATLFFIVPIASLAIYISYGFYYDKDLFFNLLNLQAARYDLGFTSIFALFQKPFLVDRFYLDGWIYFGWFAFFLLLTNVKKHFIIIFAFFSYFVIFLAGIPDEPSHGWYRYPFYPFLIISTALFIKDYFAKNWILTFFFMIIVGTSLFQLTWVQKFGFSFIIFRLAIIGWCCVLIPQFFNRFNWAGRILSYGWFGIFILMSIRAVMIYNEM